MTARRSREYSAENPDLETREIEPREGEASTPPPQTQKEKDLAQLEGYYGKVLSDLDRENQEAHAVHEASEKRMADLDAQKAQIDQEYADRRAAIEAQPEPEPTEVPSPARWSPPAVVVVRKPEPERAKEPLELTS